MTCFCSLKFALSIKPPPQNPLYISKLSKLSLTQILGLIKSCYSTPASQMQVVSGYQMQLSFVTRIFFCLFSGVLSTDCIKLWTLHSLGGTGCFYVLEHNMLKPSESSYILLTLHHNHLIHFRVSELFWQYSKCILMETVFIRTVPLHGAYSNPFPRISSAGKALTSKGSSSFSNSLPIITPITLVYFNLTTPTCFSDMLRFADLYTFQLRTASPKRKNVKNQNCIKSTRYCKKNIRWYSWE